MSMEYIRWELVPYTRGRGIEINRGMPKTFPHFMHVSDSEYEVKGYTVRPDIKFDALSKMALFADKSFDFIFSPLLLDFMEDYRATLKEWFRLLKPDGYLTLYLPNRKFPSLNKDAQFERHHFIPEDIVAAMKDLSGWDLVENQEHEHDLEPCFLQVYRKVKGWNHRDPHAESWKTPKPEKTAAVVRYGAFGDMIQTSSVIKSLKDDGFHVTVYTSPPGCEVLTHDPHIDRFVYQDKDQVPNQALGAFWEYISHKYDRFVQLSESVEGTFLAMPDRANHAWPHEVRHGFLNHNYLDFMHGIAGTQRSLIKFYATAEEKQWAARHKRGAPTIMWSLAGSSVHKTWPYLDTIIARIMIDFPEAHVYLVGGPECKMLEAGWESENRVHCMSGEWTIRESLSFLDVCDLVIGPETGVLNAACMMSMPKIVTLSHSSVENLTRDWVNTVSLFPENVACYPCHMLHYGWKYCNKHQETGTALCQASISADQMWDAIAECLKVKQEAVG